MRSVILVICSPPNCAMCRNMYTRVYAHRFLSIYVIHIHIFQCIYIREYIECNSWRNSTTHSPFESRSDATAPLPQYEPLVQTTWYCRLKRSTSCRIYVYVSVGIGIFIYLYKRGENPAEGSFSSCSKTVRLYRLLNARVCIHTYMWYVHRSVCIYMDIYRSELQLDVCAQDCNCVARIPRDPSHL